MTFDEYMREQAQAYLKATLEECGGNRTQAARVAGRGRNDFQKILKRYEIPQIRPVRAGCWDRELPA